jgi:hypothetical protein
MTKTARRGQGVFFAALLLSPSLSRAASSVDWNSAAQPVYASAENFTDAAFSLVQKPLAFLLPGRSADRFGEDSGESSYDQFARQLKNKQNRADEIIAQSMPVGPVSSAALAAWRGRVVGEERKALTDSFAATFAARYGLNRFNPLAPDPDAGAWDAGRLASTALFGSVYAYVAGLRADFRAGPVKVDVDVASGARVVQEWANGRGGRLATVRVSRGDSPLSLAAEWGARDGRADRESLALDYTRRF